MPVRWTCPNGDCPPTDVAPVPVSTFEDEGSRIALCGGACGQTYPLTAFKRLRNR